MKIERFEDYGTLTGHTAVLGFINYLKKYEERKSKIPDFERGRTTLNHEP